MKSVGPDKEQNCKKWHIIIYLRFFLMASEYHVTKQAQIKMQFKVAVIDMS